MKTLNPGLVAAVLALLLGTLGCVPADPPPPDPATVEDVTNEAMDLEDSLAGYRALADTVEAGVLLVRQHLARPDPAVNEARVARIMCVGRAGLAEQGALLEAAVQHLRAGLADLDDFTSAPLIPIANEASELRGRMALAQSEAGIYAELLSGGKCTGKETLPGSAGRLFSQVAGE